MGRQAFEDSKASGRHRDLARMAGEWEGRYRLWFEPDQLASESTQRGSLRSVLDGRFLLHEYRWEYEGKTLDGIALYGYHIDARAWESAYVDSFHTGTSILFSTAPADAAHFAALGHYGDGQGGPDWGWRTEIEQPDDDHLVITMYNITPGGEEAKAVEVRYARKR